MVHGNGGELNQLSFIAGRDRRERGGRRRKGERREGRKKGREERGTEEEGTDREKGGERERERESQSLTNTCATPIHSSGHPHYPSMK